MITKAEFLDSCAHEIRVIKHLATKVPEGGLSYRPTPAQRTTLELLRYLTSCALVPARAMVTGSWDEAEALEEASRRIEPQAFGLAMDIQEEALRDLIGRVPEDEFETREAILPWGVPQKLGLALVNTVLKPLVAYRMQLFLYAKAAGNPDIGPTNCWVGVDMPKQPATSSS